jgi:hypothetical protein
MQILGSEMFQLVSPSLVGASICILLFWAASLAVYRVYLSPLAKFPGPKLAALSSWYAFYYDVMKDGGGQFTFHIRELHRQYGMYA